LRYRPGKIIANLPVSQNNLAVVNLRVEHSRLFNPNRPDFGERDWIGIGAKWVQVCGNNHDNFQTYGFRGDSPQIGHEKVTSKSHEKGAEKKR
jgi:hypothetical protein